MALSSGSGIYNSFDRGTSLEDTAVRDVSELMFAALNVHPGTLINLIASEKPVANRKHEWVEQTLNPSKVTLVAKAVTGVENGDTETVFKTSAADAALLTEGDLLKNVTANVNEILQVTAVDSSTYEHTVVRGYGASAGSTDHSAGDEFEVMPARQEGSSIGSDRTRDRTTRYNWTQIFDTAVKISRTMMNTQMYNVPDEFKNSLMNRTLELKNQINYAMINSTAIEGGGSPSSTVYGSMSGIIPMLLTGGDIEATSYTTASAGTVIDPTTALTYDALSDLIGVCAISNGNRDGNYVIATNQTEFEVMSTWPDGQVRRQYSPNGQQYGAFVDSVMSKSGIPAKVILEPDVPPGHLLVLDVNRIKLRPLQNSAMLMYVDDLGTSGNDYQQARLVAEWTLEIHNADVAHGIMNALAD